MMLKIDRTRQYSGLSEEVLMGPCQGGYEEFGPVTNDRSLEINEEGISCGQPANPGSLGKWPLKW